MIKHLSGRPESELLATKEAAKERIKEIRDYARFHFLIGRVYANSTSIIFYFYRRGAAHAFSYEYFFFSDLSVLRTPSSVHRSRMSIIEIKEILFNLSRNHE